MKQTIAVVGSRTFNDYERLSKKVGAVLNTEQWHSPLFICGGAKGADRLGMLFAIENGYDYETFYPDWTNVGVSAGTQRNILMAEKAEIVIAFWDGQSKGTRHMINYSNKLGRKVIIERFVRPLGKITPITRR